MEPWKEMKDSLFPHLSFLISFMCLSPFFVSYAYSDNDLSSPTNNPYSSNTISQMTNGTNFSNVKCSGGLNHVLLEGVFHNGIIAYKVIFLRMMIFDKTGTLLAMGSGYIADIKPHEIKDFNAIARFNGNFTSCNIQIDNAIPK